MAEVAACLPGMTALISALATEGGVDDLRLIRGALRGRQANYGALVERYHPVIYAFVAERIGTPDAAEDVTRSVFVRAYTSLSGFRGNIGFDVWLKRLADAECRAYLPLAPPGDVTDWVKGTLLPTEAGAPPPLTPSRETSWAPSASAPSERGAIRTPHARVMDAVAAIVAAEEERARGFDSRMLLPIAVAAVICIAGVVTLWPRARGGAHVRPARAALFMDLEDPRVYAELAELVGEPLVFSERLWTTIVDGDPTRTSADRAEMHYKPDRRERD